jgi:hypothetical protein
MNQADQGVQEQMQGSGQSIQFSLTDEGSYLDYPDGAVCWHCGKRVKGIMLVKQETPACLDCTCSQSRKASLKGIRGAKGPGELLQLTDLDTTPPIQIIGHLGNIETLISVSSLIEDGQREFFEEKLARNFIQLLGYILDHPLSRLIRNYAYLQISSHETFFLPQLLATAEALKNLSLPDYVEKKLLQYNLAKILGLIDPLNPKTQSVIREAVSESVKAKDTYVQGWFTYKNHHYVPKYGNRGTRPTLQNLLTLVTVSSAQNSKNKSTQLDLRVVEMYLDSELLLPQLKNIYDLYLRKLHQKKQQLQSIVPIEKKQLQKKHLTSLFAKVLSDKSLALVFIEKLPQHIRELLVEIIWEQKLIPIEAFYQRFGLTFTPPERINIYFRYNKIELPKEMVLFRLVYPETSSSYAADDNPFVTVQPVIGTFLGHHLPPPEICAVRGQREPPSEAVVYSNYPVILNQLPLILMYQNQFSVRRSVNGKKILKGALKEAAKICGIEEPYSDVRDLEYLRTAILLEMADMLRSSSKSRDNEGWNLESSLSPAERIKQIFSAFFQPAHPLTKELYEFFHDRLDYLKDNQYYQYYPTHLIFDKREREIIMDLLNKLEPGEWVSVENFYAARNALYKEQISQYDIREEDSRWSDFYFTTQRMGRYGDEKNKTELRTFIIRDAYLLPQLKVILFFLNALGIVDAAFRKPVNEVFQAGKLPWLSSYDGLAGVALTQLGAWLLGKKAELQETASRKEAKVTLDEKRLLIRIEGDDPLISFTLEQFAVPAGIKCYQVKPELVLKGCRGRKDIQAKKTLFRNQVCNKLPPLWEDFFDSLKNQADPLRTISKQYLSFKIDPAKRELIQLLFSDSVLRQAVIKAENYQMFIEESSLRAVRKRLAELGYLMPDTTEED